MELSHHTLELSVGESVRIGNQLLSVIDTPDHGVALLVETIPDDDGFAEVEFEDFDFDAEREHSAFLSPPR